MGLTAATVVATAVVDGAMADAPPPFENFTFKRVKPPKPGALKPGGAKRITVHITPEDMTRQNPGLKKKATDGTKVAAAGEAAKAAVTDSIGTFAWFWDTVSPALDKSGPGRLEPALVRLANPPGGATGVKAPRLQGLQDIARVRGADILKATVGTEVSPALVLAVISVESGGETDAVSKAGAGGLMQLMPATAERFGVSDATKPGENIKGGVAFLDFLMKEFDRDPILVLAGYNAGENAVRQHQGVPPFSETRDYVPKVLAAFNTAKGLCLTPPQLVSDGCVFNVKLSGGS